MARVGLLAAVLAAPADLRADTACAKCWQDGDLVWLCTSVDGAADVLVVDSAPHGVAPFLSISAALAASADGDVILVCPGTYAGGLVIDHDVQLIGLAGAWETTIDLAGATGKPVVTVYGSAEVRGFTITGAAYDGSVCWYGGGMQLRNTDPSRVTAPIVRQNRIVNNQACKVGGIYVAGGAVGGQDYGWVSPRIENNIIAHNQAVSGNAGGVMLGGHVYGGIVNNNVFASNVAGSGGGAGALEFAGSSSDPTYAEAANNIFYKNVSSDWYLGPVTWSGYGTAGVAYNDFYGNVDATGAAVGYSGGTGNITRSPNFRSLGLGIPLNSYKLRVPSPCINAGHPVATYNDVDGSRNNMGAYGGPRGDW